MVLSQLLRSGTSRWFPVVRHINMARLVVALAALGLAADRSAASVFNYLDTPVDVSPAAGDWNPVDVSAYGVPPGATGVIVEMINTSGTWYNYGLRKNGSGDTWMLGTTVAQNQHHRFFMIGVDENRIFECNAGNAAVQTWLIGYTMPGVTFFTNAKNKSVTTAGYKTIDISADTGADTAIGAIFIVHKATTGARMYQLRMIGSGDDRYTDIQTKTATGAWVGVNGNEQCEMKIEDNNVDAWLVGYVTQGAVFFQNAVDKSAGGSGTPINTDISGDIGTNVANGALLEFHPTPNTNRFVAVGVDLAAREVYRDMKHNYAVTAVDSSFIFEQKIEATDMDCFMTGYTLYEPDINYRSIGTNGGLLYSTGTGSITVATNVVTFGGGASLPDNVGCGDQLTLGGQEYFVLSRDSATQVTIQGYAETTRTNQGFVFKRFANSLQSWENVRDGDLVGEKRREVGVCYNDGPFNDRLVISGSTTDALHYMHLTVAEGQRHTGLANTGAILDADGGWSNNDAITVEDEYTRIEWLEIADIHDAGDGIYFDNSPSGDNGLVSNVYVHSFWQNGNAGVLVDATGITVRNCFMTNGTTNGVEINNGGEVTIENCTILAGAYAVRGAGGSTVGVVNTIGVDGSILDMYIETGGGATVTDFRNNMFITYGGGFDPSAYGGGNQAPPADLDDLFVTWSGGASSDMHLEPMGNRAVDKGLDLSASFTDDIDGETRVWPWDIGADWEPTTVMTRSIGTDSGTIYSTGNATVSAGSNTVTFAGGASLPANVGPGDRLDVGVEALSIYAVDSSTQVTTQLPAIFDHTTEAYTIKRVYTTLQAWEDARDGDLVGDDRIEVGVCYNDGPFSAGVTIQDSTTDADHYFKLTVADGHRHDGTAGTGVRIDAAGGTGDYIVQLRDDYSVLEWLEITDFQDNKGAVMTWDGQDVTVNNLLIHDFDSLAAAIEMYHGGTIRNCIIYDGDSGIFLNMTSEGQTGIVENCTIKTLWNGVKAWTGAFAVEIRNTIVAGANTSHFNLENDTIAYFGYNMFDPTKVDNFNPDDHQGNNQAPPAVLEDLFVSLTPGSEDLHLEDDGHNAMDTGLDLSASFVMDIDGTARVTPWDIGADWNPLGVNYRSIGTDTGTLYSIGDATVALGSTTVTFGFGADLPTNIGQGDELVIDTETFYILSRDSATQVTVQVPAATAHTTDSYTIKRVYNTLQAWEDAVDGDLVADNRREIGVCYADGWFTDRLVISGSTTDAGHYMHLTVAEGQRHGGNHLTGSGIDAEGGWGGLDAITVEDEYTRIEHLLIKNVYDAGDGVFFDNSPAADNGLVNGIYVWGFWQNSNAAVRTAAPNTTIRNSFFTGGTSTGIQLMTGCTMCYIENCTIIGNPTSGSGVSDQPSTWVSIKNTISVNHQAGRDFQLWSGVAYFGNNMFDPALVTGFDPDAQDGGNQLPPSNIERLFVDTNKDTMDLHLEPRAHRAGNNGLDLSASFTDDIDGVARVDNWDIGADEAISGTDPLPPAVITWKEVDPQ